MRITQLEIVNFKALTRFRLDDLSDAVVLAGPNGCGKSCVLDAIRLLKSTYGGYQPNEWHSWFGEFQINFNQRPEDLLRLFQDPGRDLLITASFDLATSERDYLRANGTELVRAAAWREVVPELASWRAFSTTPLASQYRANNDEVERRAAQALGELNEELDAAPVTATVTVDPAGTIRTVPSRMLELAFSSYEPEHLGVLDFHSPDRQYTREEVAGVNLDLSNAQEQRRQSALYNPQQKFQGLKTEMASMYVRRVLAQEAGTSGATEDDLVDALRDLFKTFFPGKTFLGPEPTADGRVAFPVRLPDGSTHDLDDLSSGEKEVLYGYMRLRNSAPKNSVILLDEPELHLNPRLIRGLARFYFNHLVAAHNNQLWLISHSDTLLREAVNLEGFRVFHMRSGDRSRPDENQAARITTSEEVERLVIELVGDLAAYRPGAKVVLFEGGGDVEFDVRMVARLFPDFDGAVNSIAAGSKREVTALHETLDGLGAAALGARFYAIRDRDSGRREAAAARAFTWGVYHIENFLLEPDFVLRAMSELSQADPALADSRAVVAALRECARATVPSLIRHELVVEANDALVNALAVGGDPHAERMADAIHESVAGSVRRVKELDETELSLDALRVKESELRKRFSTDLETDEWRKTFRGRDILKRFVALHVGGTSYEGFRDLILARMKETGFQPSGMAAVLDGILADPFP
jgi:ABC-type nitrate/sulfonate/bicarbonate transport system ATPase subunit